MRDITGAIIEYRAKGNRRGWRGVVVRHYTNANNNRRVKIQYDNGTLQEYQDDAVMHEGATYDKFRPDLGYLEIVGWTDPEVAATGPRKPTHLVKGAFGGRCYECYSMDEARELATHKARESNSGQPYLVFKAVVSCQRVETPVAVTDIEEG